jgi:basic amino acid/polyamine antiporter, APA family
MAIANDGKMGLPMTTALVIGSIIGVGIFMLPVALAPLGMNAVVGWVVSGFGAICLGLPLARLARDGTGIQTAIADTFGPTVGFMVTWAFWVSIWSGFAALAVGAASTISRAIPSFADPVSVALLAVASVTITAIVNMRGARSSGIMAIITVLLRILPLFAVIVLVSLKTTAHNTLQPLWTQPLSVSVIATAAALTLWPITGFENVTTPVGKIRDPARTIPRALLIGVTGVAVLYVMSSTSVMLLLPADQLAHSPAPFADAVVGSWGEVAADLMVLGIAISAFGCIGCGSMAAGELCYSMALKGDLPAALSWTNRRGAPVVAQLVSSGLAILLVLSNTNRSTAALFTFIILVSTVVVLILYVVGGLAIAIRERAFGTRAMVFAGVLFSAYVLYGSGLEACLWGLGLAASALPMRAISRWLSGSSPAVVVSPAVLPE